MSELIHRARFTVGVDTGEMTPDTVINMGYTGDHLSAELSFMVYVENRKYRLEIIDGSGGYDITEPLYSNDEGLVVYRIPSAWTAPGTATVRLIEYGDDGRVTHYAPVSLFFADREEGELADHTRPRFEQLLETAETAVGSANAAADRVLSVEETLRTAESRSKTAKTTADEAHRLSEYAAALSQNAEEVAAEASVNAKAALVRAESVKGVYVGSGEMPDGYDIQIDPSGASISFDKITRPPVGVIFQCDPCVGGYSTVPPVSVVSDGTRQPDFFRYRVFKLWIGDLYSDNRKATEISLFLDNPSLDSGGGRIGSAATVDKDGNYYTVTLSCTADRSIVTEGVRIDKNGYQYTQGIYRLMGVV